MYLGTWIKGALMYVTFSYLVEHVDIEQCHEYRFSFVRIKVHTMGYKGSHNVLFFVGRSRVV